MDGQTDGHTLTA